jgi:hypothetical protein
MGGNAKADLAKAEIVEADKSLLDRYITISSAEIQETSSARGKKMTQQGRRAERRRPQCRSKHRLHGAYAVIAVSSPILKVKCWRIVLADLTVRSGRFPQWRDATASSIDGEVYKTSLRMTQVGVTDE